MSTSKLRIGTEVVIKEWDGPSPEGKRFLAWNTREDGTGIIYKPGKAVVMVESLHLWPMWTDASEEADE